MLEGPVPRPAFRVFFVVDDLAGISDPTERLVRAVTRACSVAGNAVQLDDPEILVAARPDIWPSTSAIPTNPGPSGGPDGWNSQEVAYWFQRTARARGFLPNRTYRARGRVRGLFGITRSGYVEVPAWFIASVSNEGSGGQYILQDGSLARGGLLAEHLITIARTFGLS
jgi:hypothetical protein